MDFEVDAWFFLSIGCRERSSDDEDFLTSVQTSVLIFVPDALLADEADPSFA